MIDFVHYTVLHTFLLKFYMQQLGNIYSIVYI